MFLVPILHKLMLVFTFSPMLYGIVSSIFLMLSACAVCEQKRADDQWELTGVAGRKARRQMQEVTTTPPFGAHVAMLT
jgi:hypothetical protein